MSYLQTLLQSKIMSKVASIHDCHNDVTEQVISSGTDVIYGNDKSVYEFKNASYNTWDSANSLIDMTNVALNSKVDIILGGEMKAGTSNANLIVELFIPATAGDIIVKRKVFLIPDVGVYHEDDIAFHPYNGAASNTDNFQVRLYAVGGNVTIKNSTILVRV